MQYALALLVSTVHLLETPSGFQICTQNTLNVGVMTVWILSFDFAEETSKNNFMVQTEVALESFAFHYFHQKR